MDLATMVCVADCNLCHSLSSILLGFIDGLTVKFDGNLALDLELKTVT